MIRERRAPRRCTSCKQRRPIWLFGFCKECHGQLPDDLRERLTLAALEEPLDDSYVFDAVEFEAATMAALEYLEASR